MDFPRRPKTLASFANETLLETRLRGRGRPLLKGATGPPRTRHELRSDGLREISGLISLDLVATGSYHESMKAIARVGVKNLKNNLSAYLRQVKRGVRVLVTDRDEVIAEIGKPRDEHGELSPLFEEWIRRGEL